LEITKSISRLEKLKKSMILARGKEALREHINSKKEFLKETLRHVIREELSTDEKKSR